MTGLLELAERVEAATGASILMEIEANLALVWPPESVAKVYHDENGRPFDVVLHDGRRPYALPLLSDPAAPLRLIEERWPMASITIDHVTQGSIWAILSTKDAVVAEAHLTGIGGDLAGRMARALTAALLRAEATR